MLCKTVLAVYMALAAYVALGGVVFHFIETPNEKRTMRHRFRLYTNYLRDRLYPDDNNNQTTKGELDRFLDDLGVDVLELDGSNNASHWTIPNSIYFSSVLISTIGYGNMAPKTPMGQLFCCVYALIGIPLHVVLLTAIGSKLGGLIYKRMRQRSLLAHRKLDVVLKSGIVLTVLLSLIVFFPALALSALEGWTYLESLYCIVVTLTTIGLGDYIAGQNVDMAASWVLALYRLVAPFWMLTGLALVAAGVSLVATAISARVEKTGNSTQKRTVKGQPVEDRYVQTTLSGGQTLTDPVWSSDWARDADTRDFNGSSVTGNTPVMPKRYAKIVVI